MTFNVNVPRWAQSSRFLIHRNTTPTNRTYTQASAAAARLVTQLGLLLDEATTADPDSHRHDPRVLIVGATNRPHEIHPALRRPGRLDKEVGGCGWVCIQKGIACHRRSAPFSHPSDRHLHNTNNTNQTH